MEDRSPGFAWHKVVRVLLYVIPIVAVLYVYARVLEFGIVHSAQYVHEMLFVVDALLLVVFAFTRGMFDENSYIRSHTKWIFVALLGSMTIHAGAAVLADAELQRILLFAPITLAVFIVVVRFLMKGAERNNQSEL